MVFDRVGMPPEPSRTASRKHMKKISATLLSSSSIKLDLARGEGSASERDEFDSPVKL